MVDFIVPKSLMALMRGILIISNEINNAKKKTIDISITNICEIIMSSIKSERQVNYESVSESKAIYKKGAETPFSLGLSLYIHKETRSKKLIDSLKAENNNGVYTPLNIRNGINLHFAIDNTDFQNDTPDGKSEFHRIGFTVFQKKN